MKASAAAAALACQLASLLIAADSSQALPMSFKGSSTIGVELDHIWSSAWFSHAVQRQLGLGISAQLIPGSAGHGDGQHTHGTSELNSTESFLLLDSTHLLKRWNMNRAQSNLWLFAGVGTYQSWNNARVDATRIAARPGLQFDIENTRLRFEAKGQLFLAQGVERSMLSATTGVGLTPPRYQGVQPWLELQVRAMPGVIDEVEIIPKLRLLHRKVVIDVGYSSLGSLTGSVTTTF
jgi:opacity protein-like surface antigen